MLSLQNDGNRNRVKSVLNGVTTYYIGNYYEYVNSSTTKKYYYAGGQRVAMRKGNPGTLSFLLGDHLGSTSITANSSGSKVAELRYHPWGGTRYTSGTTPTSYQFTGQRNDSSIGLYFYNARYYDGCADAAWPWAASSRRIRLFPARPIRRVSTGIATS